MDEALNAVTVDFIERLLWVELSPSRARVGRSGIGASSSLPRLSAKVS
jgi:hypothetical protein